MTGQCSVYHYIIFQMAFRAFISAVRLLRVQYRIELLISDHISRMQNNRKYYNTSLLFFYMHIGFMANNHTTSSNRTEHFRNTRPENRIAYIKGFRVNIHVKEDRTTQCISTTTNDNLYHDKTEGRLNYRPIFISINIGFN